MADTSVTIRERNYLRNPLLSRRQFVLEINHPGKANLSRTEIAALLTKVILSVVHCYSVFLFAFFILFCLLPQWPSFDSLNF
jgi:small subunit ribosomal protein S24e